MEIQILEERNDDVFEALVSGVREYNTQILGPAESKPLIVIARDHEDKVVGGVAGRMIYGHYLIEVVWIDEPHRGKGLGRELMEEAESKARENGCTGSQVDTLSFQGLEFYQKLGFSVIGKVTGFPLGYDRYFMGKEYE